MPAAEKSFRWPGGDCSLLFLTRGLRMLGFGLLSVVLVLFLKAVGLPDREIGTLLTLSLLGDVVTSLGITRVADRVGRRKMLVLGAALMLLVGIGLATTGEFLLLAVVVTVGVLSASDKEVGPFQSIEQAALSQSVVESERTSVFAWYNLTGSLCAALGALIAGAVCQWQIATGVQGADIYRGIVWAYAGIGLLLAFLFVTLSRRIEAERVRDDQGSGPRWYGLGESRGVILHLAGLFALDSFGGGFVLQGMLAYWLRVRFQVEPAVLGGLFFLLNVLASGSSLAASALATRIGLVQTMVYTHLPSSVLLMLVPFMPRFELAALLLILRSCICEMDVPVRQSYVMSVVQPDERAAAAGIAAVARSLGRAAAPLVAVYCLSSETWNSVPFLIAGGTKIAYDLLLYRAFVRREAKGVSRL